jgi:hypothetical protein
VNIDPIRILGPLHQLLEDRRFRSGQRFVARDSVLAIHIR